MKKFKLLLFLLINVALCDVNAVDIPIASDSRIKTFVYNENEVFRVIIHYGYQTSIEFAENETIRTISIGNNYAWQLTPLGRRLFIKPLEENIITNMTVLTNERAYHFEIQSKLISYTIDEELAYVVRFYYPEYDLDKQVKENFSRGVGTSAGSNSVSEPFNFSYTMSGNSDIAPVQIFDDGRNTFFKFDGGMKKIPSICAYKSGKLVSLKPRQRGEYVTVNTVAKEFVLEMNSNKVRVYNDSVAFGG